MYRCFLRALAFVAITAGVASACPPESKPGMIDVYPSGDTVPENLLRIYIYFPRPMSRFIRASDLQVFDQQGKPVDDVFLPNRYDLWSPDRMRLTVLLDPGRVKTGLIANELLGRALTAGQSYTLFIPGTLRDQQGCTIGQSFEKHYRIEAADRAPPQPVSWEIAAPQANSLEVLTIDLGSPHDHLSLAYRLRVYTTEGEPVSGTLSLHEGEQVWRFAPKQKWQARSYEVRVDPQLEDLAGNRPGTPFDRSPDTPIAAWQDVLVFQPRHNING